MKTTYKIAVGGTSIVVAPDLGVTGVADFAAGAVAQGDYVKGTNGFTYWAINGGTATVSPTHKNGVELVDDIEWLLVGHSRHLIISADEAGNCYCSKNSEAVIGEGMRMDGYRPAWDLGSHVGSINAISDGGVTLSIQHSQG